MLLGEATILESGVATKVPQLDLLPATVDLSGAEIELVSIDDRTHRLAQAFDEVPAGRWDICLLDCPPSLGLLTVNALVASRQLLVPLQCEFLGGRTQPAAAGGRADPPRLQSATIDPGRRADHVRPAQQFVVASSGRCSGLPRNFGVRYRSAAQCAPIGSAEPWPSGANLRSPDARDRKHIRLAREIASACRSPRPNCMKRATGLGRGLSALIGEAPAVRGDTSSTGGVKNIVPGSAPILRSLGKYSMRTP